VATISFHIKILYCFRTLDIFIYHLMKTVEIFRLDMFGLDAYLVQPEENKKFRIPHKDRLSILLSGVST
jgi:hypothetical protein